MKLSDVFKRKERKNVDIKELEIYSGMRVAVETLEGQLLFIGDLQDPFGGTAKLCQCSDGEFLSSQKISPMKEPMQVHLRGYNNRKRKAVFMNGIITPGHRHIWQIEELTITKVENERTFYRLDTDIDAVITAAEGAAGGEMPCKLLNLSVGGASIHSEYPYRKGDRFLLKVKLLENESETVLYCEVLRVAEKSDSSFEYGCHFLELTKADQSQIAQSISAHRPA